MKKVLIGLLIAIACVVANDFLTISADAIYSNDVVIENTTIKITKDGMYNITNETLTVSNVKFCKNTTDTITNIFTIGENATLVLNDVDFSGISGSCAIINNGKLIANNVNFGNGFSNVILLNSNVDNPCVFGGDITIDSISIAKGYITMNEDTNILSNVKVCITDGYVGMKVVTGDNTYAGYYIDKFEFVDNEDSGYYLDYVGDDYASYEDEYKSSDSLIAGDIILTEDYANFMKGKKYYIAGKYCTASRFVLNNTMALDEDSVMVYATCKFFTNKAINNTNCMMVAGYSVNLCDDYNIVTANIKYICNGEEVGESKQVSFPNGVDWSVFIDIPQDYDFVSVDDSISGDNVIVTNTFMNSKFAKCIISTTEENTAYSFDVIVNLKQQITVTNVNILLENDSMPYTGGNLKNFIKPYYILNDEKYYVDFIVEKDGIAVETIISVGEYVVKITSTPSDNLCFNNLQLSFTITKKEISINYSNTTHRYDGSEKSLTAELVGVDSNDVNLTLENNSGVMVGEYVVTAKIDNVNYILEKSSTSCTLVITKGIYDVSNITPLKTIFEYTGDEIDFKLNEENIPSFITYTASSNGCINPNDYYVNVIFSINTNDLYDEVNYPTRTFKITISKKTVDMSKVRLSDKTFVYDRSSHSLELEFVGIDALPDGVTINRVENNGKINAGIYEVKYYFEYNEDIFEEISPISATMIINKAKVSVNLLENEYVYTGSAIMPKVDMYGIIVGDDDKVGVNSNINVGTYPVIITLSESIKGNYIIELNDLKYSITPKEVDLSGITLVKTEIVYNGSSYIPQIAGNIPEVIESFNLVYSDIKNVGVYTVTANIEVSSNYSVSNWSKTVVVTPKYITITFSDYDELYQDGNLKSIGVTLNGVIEENFNKYLVTYSPRPIEAGNYTCTVTLLDNSNYVIAGSNSIAFKIYPNVKVYTNDEMSVTIQGGNGNISDLSVSCTTKDIQVENALKNYSSNINGYNVINFDGENKEVSISLKTNLNISNVNNIKVFKIMTGNLIAIDFVLQDNVITFDGDSNFQYVIIEEGDEFNELALIIIVVAFAMLVLCSVVGLLIIRKNKRRK